MVLSSVFAVAAPGQALAAPNLATISATTATDEAVARYKRTHDTGTWVEPSSQQRARWAAQKRQRPSTGSVGTMAIQAESRTLRANQQPQINGWYCGPASVSEALNIRGMNVSQSYLGGLLRTTQNGTDWYGTNAAVPNPTMYPVPDVLNYYTGAGFEPVYVNGVPSAAETTTFQNRLIADIDAGYPLIGDAWEVPGGPHLVGHPNTTIYHWFMIRGYSQWGAQTHYEDSATSVWATVPAYAAMSSKTITQIVGGRGYVW